MLCVYSRLNTGGGALLKNDNSSGRAGTRPGLEDRVGARQRAKGGKVADPRQVIFGASIRLHRQRRGWTQEQLSIILHYEDKTMISQLERGERAPSFLKAVEIAELFETSVNAMCGYSPHGSITHNHAGAVAMNTGFVMFGGLEFKDLREMVDTVLQHHGEGYDRMEGTRSSAVRPMQEAGDEVVQGEVA